MVCKMRPGQIAAVDSFVRLREKPERTQPEPFASYAMNEMAWPRLASQRNMAPFHLECNYILFMMCGVTVQVNIPKVSKHHAPCFCIAFLDNKLFQDVILGFMFHVFTKNGHRLDV